MRSVGAIGAAGQPGGLACRIDDGHGLEVDVIRLPEFATSWFVVRYQPGMQVIQNS
jgi:hypothetical protein